MDCSGQEMTRRERPTRRQRVKTVTQHAAKTVCPGAVAGLRQSLGEGASNGDIERATRDAAGAQAETLRSGDVSFRCPYVVVQTRR